MATLPAAKRDAIAKLLEQKKVAEAYEKLAAHPDLKQTDLPSLEKRALAAIGVDRDAASAFVAGLVSLSGSVRRMARKYVPKLVPHGADAALLLLVESARPFRKLAKGEKSLAGDFGAWASPLGRAVVEEKLSFEIKNPTVAVYSEATKFMKEACENLAQTVAMLDDATVLRAYELAAAVRRPFARIENMPLPEDHPGTNTSPGPFFAVATFYDQLNQEMRERLKKNAPHLLGALERWARHEMSIEDDAPAGSAAAAVRARWAEVSETERASSRAIMAVCAASFLRSGLDDAKSVALYWRLKASPPGPTEGHRYLMQGMLTGFERQNPRETKGPAPSPLPSLLPGAAPAPGTAAKTEAAAPVAEAPPLLDPHVGPAAESALGSLVSVADQLGLPGLWKELVKEAELDWLEESDAPEAKDGPADAETTVRAVRETIKTAATSSKERDELARAVLGSISAGEGE